MNIDSQFVTGIARLKDQLVILLDLNLILAREEEEQLMAARKTLSEANSL